MTLRASFDPSFRLAALFVLLAGVPLVALGLIGWRLLDQDRALERERLRAQLENAATLVGREVDRNLAAWEEVLQNSTTSGVEIIPPKHTALLVLDSRGLLAHQGIPLPYFPAVAAQPEVPADAFAGAEGEEFREGDLSKAIASYRRLSRHPDRGTRAAALMRLARALRNQHQLSEALGVYADLAGMGATPVAGTPAELVARHERIALFRAVGDEANATHEETALTAALVDGRFPIDRATFDFLSESIRSLPASTAGAELAEAVDALWPIWQQQPSGRAAWTSDAGVGFSAVWRQGHSATAVLVGTVDTLVAPSLSAIETLHVQLALVDQAARPSWGKPPADAAVSKTFRETGLPWTMSVWPSDSDAVSQAASDRRRLWLAGFALMVLVIAVASYLVVRSVSRELAVVRLQSDFVAAVSHEFRTPLTAMRHLTEMLEEGSASANRLPEYFRALGKETRRLQGMVESLLDFGRLESGRRTYRMEEMSAAALTAEVVDEFRSQSSTAAQRVMLRAIPSDGADRLHIRVDHEALSLAIRNLLDNAVKYSPASSEVSVAVEAEGAFAGIAVEDRGAGIRADERRDIFRKFVRGTAARTLNVKGTGIGLAMVDQIVRAHGGRLELASELGRGSRFTILLPLVPAPATTSLGQSRELKAES